MTGELKFFVELANALKHTPPKAQDAVVAESLADRLQGHQHDLRRHLPERAGKGGLIKAVQFGQYIMDVYAQTAGER